MENPDVEDRRTAAAAAAADGVVLRLNEFGGLCCRLVNVFTLAIFPLNVLSEEPWYRCEGLST